MHTASLGTVISGDISKRYHIRPSPKGSGLMGRLVLRLQNLTFPTMSYRPIYYVFLALMLLDFTMRRMVRSTHLAHISSPKRFAAQIDFAALNKYAYKKIHTASLGTARCRMHIFQYFDK